jgi:hypothetical protein
MGEAIPVIICHNYTTQKKRLQAGKKAKRGKSSETKQKQANSAPPLSKFQLKRSTFN